MKFTSYEATDVVPFIANSPLVGWWHAALGIQGSSYMLSVFEIATGVLLAARAFAPIAAVVSGAMAALTFMITLGFFFTTQGFAAPMEFPANQAAVAWMSAWLRSIAMPLITPVRRCVVAS